VSAYMTINQERASISDALSM